MGLIKVSFEQFLQLRACEKSFCALFFPVWQNKSYNKVLGSLLSCLHSFDTYVLVVEVFGSCSAEEYVINELQVQHLPAVGIFVKGRETGLYYANANANANANSFPGLSKFFLENYKKFLAENFRTLKPQGSEHTFPSFVQSLVYTRQEGVVGKLFISGDRSSVGKSSICLGLLITLLRKGISPGDIAYIKPVTQCEAEQPITRFCERIGITHRSIGPVVFYQGFTRAYLAGDTEPYNVLLSQVCDAVEQISLGKKITIVDGVGYPSVGSICNISNADVAQALSAPVLLVGKSGVGDAVDSYNLNSAFFQLRGVRVLGGIFNKLSLEGYYNLQNCRDSVSSYFSRFRPDQKPYGFLPALNVAADMTGTISIQPDIFYEGSTPLTVRSTNSTSGARTGEGGCEVDSVEAATISRTLTSIELTPFELALSDAFLKYVNTDRIIHDTWMSKIIAGEQVPAQAVQQAIGVSGEIEQHRSTTASVGGYVQSTRRDYYASGPDLATRARAGLKRSREEVEMAARRQGARAGG